MNLMHDLSQLHEATGGPTSERTDRPPAQAGMALLDETVEPARARQRIWHGQKLEALGRLAAGIAHDFSNLVTVILGYSHLLDSHLGPGDPRHDLVCEIHRAAMQAERLTRQILSFAAPQATAPQILDLGQVLCGTEKMLRRLIGENIFLSTSIAAGLAPVKADQGQIEQIIVNLAVNARDAMPQGGKLTIEVCNVAGKRGAGPESVPENYVMMAFTDSGIGMSPAIRARIFEPFFTTKAAGKGTGLGLSMVDEIVKQNGGHIEVQSEVGRGTTFKVFLPQSQEPPAAQHGDGEISPMPKGSEVVLLVEDEMPVRNLVRQVLQMCGYTVIEAVDGKEAVELAKEHEGPIHLLLTDVVLPHMGGCQLAEVIRTRHPELRVLFLSGHSIDYVYERGGQQAEFSFLQKPFTVDALAQKVREALGHPGDTLHD